MGMTAGPDGSLQPDTVFLRAYLERMSDFKHENFPPCFFLQYPNLVDSSDMTPRDWTDMASVIARYYDDFDGFTIIHGTDTMAYTASALSFLLENLAKPVILTGAQLPLTEFHSDARRNLVHAILYSTKDICEVCICFNSKIFRGNRTCKWNSESFDPYWSPNLSPLSEIGVELSNKEHLLLPPARGRFTAHLQPLNAKILVLYIIPGFCFESLRPLKDAGNHAIVFVLFGSGNAPQRKGECEGVLQELSQTSVLVACSQCQTGAVNLEKYVVGQAMKTAGLISVLDMTIEATVTKLQYLFSRNLTNQEIKMAMTTNLRGELTEGHRFEDLLRSKL